MTARVNGSVLYVREGIRCNSLDFAVIAAPLVIACHTVRQ